MAQAVAAQAFARTAELVPDDDDGAACAQARAAYRAIPGHLLTSVAAGPWIRLYSFSSLAVLNAQLQAVISLQSYADAPEDAGPARSRRACSRAAAATLPRFDTGYWTYYALPARSVAARLPAVRRPAAEAARADRRTLRRRGDALRGVRSSSRRRSSSTNAGARHAALLALEAVDA